MKFLVTIEQVRLGYVEVEVPDEKWEKHTYPYVRRKFVKQAAVKALENGDDILWLEPKEPEATTMFYCLDGAPYENEWRDYMAQVFAD